MGVTWKYILLKNIVFTCFLINNNTLPGVMIGFSFNLIKFCFLRGRELIKTLGFGTAV